MRNSGPQGLMILKLFYARKMPQHQSLQPGKEENEMNEHLGNNTLGVVTAPGTVCIKRVLPGPIERVWAYLTESDKRRKWLARGPISSFVGGDVELTFHHS